ncbi:MAG: hypothetical protein H7Y88_08595 [Phycisphaerales bacterium]|nr:hypothetical protein [Phycisphaerales bacterium]
MNAGTPEITVICPLDIERRAVERALRLRVARSELEPVITVVCSGPGTDAVRSAVTRYAAASSELVLAGLCGGLTPGEDASQEIAEVIDSRGGHWRCAERGAVLIGVDEPVCSVEAKRALAARTGAALVDMESHGFAAACSEAGVPWRIIREVSDGGGAALPRQAASWVDERGRMRGFRVLVDVLRRPWCLPALMRLGRDSKDALRRLGVRVVAAVEAAEEGRARLRDSTKALPGSGVAHG